MLVYKNNRKWPNKFCIIIKPNSQKTFYCIVLYTNMAAVKSDENPQYHNRPFPSSCLPPLQSESKCEVFVMVISSTLHINENEFS